MAKRPKKSGPYKPRAATRERPAHFLREWRIYRNLTQERAAERAELSVASISQLENGGQGVSDRALAALAHAFNCEIADLYRDPNRPDYQLWRIINGLSPEAQEQALRVIRALAGEAAA